MLIMDRMYIGDLEKLSEEQDNSIHMYISSSDDMAVEKSFLKQNIIPKLRDLSLSLGFDLNIIDLKWVNNIAFNQHPDNVQLRLNLLEKFSKSSNLDCYIMLLDERCGHQSLPKAIPSNEFEKLIQALKEEGSDVSLLKRFFIKDENKLESEYILETEGKLTNEDLVEITESINSLLKRAANRSVETKNMVDKDAEKYLMSDLEREISTVLYDYSDKKHQSACFIRKYQNPNDPHHKQSVVSYGEINMSFQNEIDGNANITTNTRNKDSFPNVLLEKIRKLLHLSNFNTLEVPIKDGGINCKHLEHKLYLRQLGESFKQVGTKLIQKIANSRKHENTEKRTQLYNEVLLHSKLVSEKCDNFYSRDELVNQVKTAFKSCKQQKDKKPIVIHGSEGSGKTSLLSLIVKKAAEWLEMSTLNVIFRFVGTTPCSDDIETLIFSICQQISLIYQQPPISRASFDDYETLLQYLYQLLKNLEMENYPLMILIDGIDNLENSNNAHQLNWLPKKLGKNLYFVVSTNTSHVETFSALKKCLQDTESFIEVTDINDQSAAIILKNFVTKYQRKLNDEQLDYITQCARQCRNPLYLNLAIAEVLSWKSYDEVIPFPLNISEFIYSVMEKLENKFGEVFVSHTLCYITASKCGMSENELEDVLSLDNYVMSEIYDSNELIMQNQTIDCDLSSSQNNKKFWLLNQETEKSTILRLPTILWKKLFENLKPYITSFCVYGKTTYTWTHQVFKNIAKEKYLQEAKTIKIIYSNLSEYFSNVYADNKPKQIVLENIDGSKYENSIRLVQSQPNYYGTKHYNIRKMQELPYALNNLRDQKNLFKEVIFNFDFLRAKVTAMSLNKVVKDVKLVIESTNDKETEILYETLKLSSFHVNQRNEALACEIIARMKGYCNDENEKITNLVLHAQNYVTHSQHEAILVRNSSMVPAGGDEHFTCLGQPGEIVDIKCFDDSKRVLILSMDEHFNANLHLWDIISKECIKKLIFKSVNICPKIFMDHNNENIILLADYIHVIDFKADGKCWQIESENAEYLDMAYHKESGIIAFYTTNNVFKFYDMNKKSYIKTFEPDFEDFEIFTFIENSGDLVFSKCSEHLAMFYHLNSNEIHPLKANKKMIVPGMKVYALISNGDYAIMGVDSLIFVMDSITHSIHKKFSDHKGRISTLINLQADIFGSASYDQTIKTFSISRKVVMKTFEGHDAPITTLAYCTINNLLVSGSKDSFIRVWNRKNNTCIKVLFGHRKKIKSLKATSNGKFIISGSADKSVKIWKTQIEETTQPTFIYHNKRPIAICMSQDEKYVATLSESEVILWDEISAKIIKTVPAKCCCLTFSSDGHFLLVGAKTGFVNAYDVHSKSFPLIFSYKAHEKETRQITSLREKNKILSAGLNGTLFIFNIYERRVVQIFKNHTDAVTSLILSQDKNFVLSGSEDSVVNVYERHKEYQHLHKLQGHEKPITCLEISKNNKYVISGSEDSYIFLWYVSTGLNINRIKCNENSIVKSVAFYGTAVSALSTTTGKLSQIKSWEPNTGECIEAFEGHTDSVNCLAVTNEENYFLTCSKDGMVGLWKANTAKLLDTVNYDSEVLSITLSKHCENSHYKAAVIVANGTVSFLHVYLPINGERETRRDDRLKLVEDMRHRMGTLTQMKKRGCFCCAKYFT